NLRLPELLLMRVDKMTMGVGLEGRVPFLDHRFVALAFTIPSALKIKNGTLKYVLKKAVKGIVPDALINRRKQGFGVPVNELFHGSLQAMARRELRQFCADTDLLDAAEVERVLEGADGSKRWYLLNLALWWRTFIAQDVACPPVLAPACAAASPSSAQACRRQRPPRMSSSFRSNKSPTGSGAARCSPILAAIARAACSCTGSRALGVLCRSASRSAR